MRVMAALSAASSLPPPFTTTAFSGNFSENSYRAGLSWQPTAAQHYYAGWSDSFSPTADLYQLSGSQYPAERSKVVELGSKWLLADGNLSLRTSLYRAIKDWERNTDLESTATILTRKRQSDGIELEVREPVPGYHANVRTTDATLAAALAPVTVLVETPQYIWA